MNVATGDDRIGQALLLWRIDKVSFPGAARPSDVGRRMAAAAGQALVPVILELATKSPNIIFDHADLDRVTMDALAGIFGATDLTSGLHLASQIRAWASL